jgi:flagellar protein FlaG
MEIGPVARPGPTNAAPASRFGQSGPTVAVGAQLSEAAVEQAPTAPKVKADTPHQAAASPDSVDRKIKIDPATQQVIYETVDKDSGQVVRQVPEETMLRLQIYARAMRRAEASVKRQDHSYRA